MKKVILISLLAFAFSAPVFAKKRPVLPHIKPPRAEMIAFAKQMEIKYGLDEDLLIAICTRESQWDTNAVGTSGEIGVCQLMPETVTTVLCKNCFDLPYERLLIGAHGPFVQKIQAVLEGEGLYSGVQDGRFGQGTKEAVENYQIKYKLTPVDGIVGPGTWAQMFPDRPFPGTKIVHELWDPFKNIEWAARNLAHIRDTWSDNPLVMSAIYNGGPANPVNQYSLGIQRFLLKKQEAKEKAREEELKKQAAEQVEQATSITFDFSRSADPEIP